MIPQLEIGDIVLYKGTSFFAKCVKFFTKSKYSHAFMMISQDHIIEANWYKRVNIIDFKYNPKKMEVYRLKSGLTMEQQISLVQDSFEFLGKYYDYPQIFGYIIEFFNGKKINPFNSSKFIICSELLDRSYSKIGIHIVKNKVLGDVTPNDIGLAVNTLDYIRVL